jgi:hypothetical protein
VQALHLWGHDLEALRLLQLGRLVFGQVSVAVQVHELLEHLLLVLALQHGARGRHVVRVVVLRREPPRVDVLRASGCLPELVVLRRLELGYELVHGHLQAVDLRVALQPLDLGLAVVVVAAALRAALPSGCAAAAAVVAAATTTTTTGADLLVLLLRRR